MKPFKEVMGSLGQDLVDWFYSLKQDEQQYFLCRYFEYVKECIDNKEFNHFDIDNFEIWLYDRLEEKAE